MFIEVEIIHSANNKRVKALFNIATIMVMEMDDGTCNILHNSIVFVCTEKYDKVKSTIKNISTRMAYATRDV